MNHIADYYNEVFAKDFSSFQSSVVDELYNQQFYATLSPEDRASLEKFANNLQKSCDSIKSFIEDNA